MKKFLITLLSLICVTGCLFMTACGEKNEGDNAEGGNEITTEMYIKIEETMLTAKLVDNSSTRALKEMLPLTINMNDYGNMEKVGPLGKSLPRNDESISTDAGDLILYQGNSFVIYYDTNHWNFTRLGKIEGVSKSELKNILGSGSVTVVLSLTK